nr:hypothetical protein [Tanacetum cinerariifolium]
MGRIFKIVGLRWVPTGKIFTSSITKVDSKPPHGSNADITNPHECIQSLDVSASTLNLSAYTSFNPKKERLRVCSNLVLQRQMTPDNNTSCITPPLQKTSDRNRLEFRIQDHNNEPSSSKLVPNVSSLVDTDASSLQELDVLFSPLYEEYFTTRTTSVSKPSALSNNSQQQDTQPPLNVQSTTELIIQPTTVNTWENNNDQAADAHLNHKNLSTHSIHRYKKLLSLPIAMSILQTCIHSTNDIVPTTIGLKIIL